MLSGRRCWASLLRLRDRIDARAGELRREVPCLAHTDANFHNIIVATDHVTLIDWDNPAVRYPLEELEALEEHSSLNGIPELPAAFFAGYGREVSRPLLRLHRMIGCLGRSARPSGPTWQPTPDTQETSGP